MLQIGFVFSECHCSVFRVHTLSAGAEVAAATSLACEEHKPWGSVWGVGAFPTHSGSSTEHPSLCFLVVPCVPCASLCSLCSRGNSRHSDVPSVLQGERSPDRGHHQHRGQLHLPRDRLRGAHQRGPRDRRGQHQGEAQPSPLLDFTWCSCLWNPF